MRFSFVLISCCLSFSHVKHCLELNSIVILKTVELLCCRCKDGIEGLREQGCTNAIVCKFIQKFDILFEVCYSCVFSFITYYREGVAGLSEKREWVFLIMCFEKLLQNSKILLHMLNTSKIIK